MKTSLFDFRLPESLIATRPVKPRDAARLLVVEDRLKDAIVADLPAFLKPGDIMVFNDSRVMPARLFGKKDNTDIEALLHKDLGEGQWMCFARPGKKLKLGDRVVFGEELTGAVKEKLPDGQIIFDFKVGDVFMSYLIGKLGHMPLPPYIEKKRKADEADKRDYQTIYAAYEGSVAAPTAGLHFTPTLLENIHALGVNCVRVTLHVGGGTFLPVKTRNTDDHTMHSEWVSISPEVAKAVNEAKKNGGRVIAVGSTSLRVLESAADEKGVVKPFTGETKIFITPGYQFKCVDMLLTNFHLPCSTLFMLVSAFSGLDRMKKAYKHAIKKKYRFYSYGDACLLYRDHV